MIPKRCQLSIGPAGQRSSLLSTSISKATKLQPRRRRKWSDVFLDVFIFSGFVFEDEKIGKEVKLKKWLRRTLRRLSMPRRRGPPRRRPGRCVASRARAVVPAVPGRLRRSAAGACGGGTPRCHVAVFGGPRRPAPRLRCAGPPLLSLPGAAGLAAAGRIRPRNGAAGGDGGAIPGGERLVQGARRMAAAVPRRMRDGAGWGVGHQRSRKVLIFLHRSHWSHLNSNYTRAILLHIFLVHTCHLLLLYSFWTLTSYSCGKFMFDISAVWHFSPNMSSDEKAKFHWSIFTLSPWRPIWFEQFFLVFCLGYLVGDLYKKSQSLGSMAISPHLILGRSHRKMLWKIDADSISGCSHTWLFISTSVEVLKSGLSFVIIDLCGIEWSFPSLVNLCPTS